jgi:mono/diheme cytochrome c family protein
MNSRLSLHRYTQQDETNRSAGEPFHRRSLTPVCHDVTIKYDLRPQREFDDEMKAQISSRPRMLRKSLCSLMFLVLCRPAVQAQSQTAKTVLDGAFSEVQAKRGQAAYTTHCSVCHGETLEGVSAPELKGNHFLERWREDTLDTFYDFIRENMPFGRPANAKRIPDTDYLDILTHILNMNGYPAGADELTPDRVGNIMLVGKDGPQPVPDGSLVVTLGCLSQNRDGVWILFNATEPVRSRRLTILTSSERTALSQRGLGTLIFRLADLEAVPDFAPDTHKGHKMRARGYLVRQPKAERINLSSIEMVDSACGP